MFERILNWFLEDSQLIVISSQKLYLKLAEELDIDADIPLEKKLSRSEKALFKRLCSYFSSQPFIGSHNHKITGYSYFSNQKKIKEHSAERIILDLYPFGMLSHTSALLVHGYPIPIKQKDIVMYTAVDRKTWQQNCIDELPTLNDRLLEKKLFKYENRRLWMHPYPQETEILDKQVVLFSDKNLAYPVVIDSLRVQSLFDCLLKATQKPQYYGSFTFVIDLHRVLIKNNNLYKYIGFIDRNGSLMDKARIGFILEKVLHFPNTFIDKWKAENEGKRGGSRKIISYLPYSDIYDEEWNISLNSSIFQEA
ncbi:hypothetical protein [Acinetobacter johnsonii]|uniref:hypothetical protein n=1 Tax=Acinetobacter johnsonii TaxID=40214 RepID=UPI00216AB04A|nr:hypothetical protein [Acinetobacter johnsonii]MCS3528624.1 hypothetical protein [Acinetobacter johnsonii]